jgi:two-component system chemotaxis sensor kinase CheA
MRVSFQAEAADLLSELDSSLLELETKPGDLDLVNRVFRALHTIKGSGATAQFRRLSQFAHKVEEVFNGAREGKLRVSPDLMDYALRACDLLRELLNDADETPGFECDLERELVAALSGFAPASTCLVQVPESSATTSVVPVQNSVWKVEFRPYSHIFSSGVDPSSLVAELSAFGTGRVTTHLEAVPDLDSIDPEQCYSWWEVEVLTGRGEEEIRNVFLFVEDDCDLIVTKSDLPGAGSTRLITVELAEPFIIEALDQIDEVDGLLVELEKNSQSASCIGSLFRLLHSLKGNVGLLLSSCPFEIPPTHALRVVQRVAHAAETSLEQSRDTGLASPANLATLFEAADYLRALIGVINSDEPSPAIPIGIRSWMGSDSSQSLEGAGGGANPKYQAFVNTAEQCLENMGQCFTLFANGNFNAQAASAYLRSAKTLAAASQYADYENLQTALSRHLSIAEKCIVDSRVDGSCREQMERDYANFKTSIAHPESYTDEAPTQKLEGRPSETKFRGSDTGPQSIRVDQEKLDRLMRVVSELLVARGTLPILSKRLDREFHLSGVAKELKDAASDISRIADELQSTVMAIRMLPIDTVFQRFPRLVRDLARTLNKEIDIIFRGEDTEVDKSVIQAIADPLVHIVRNAADHGIEIPEVRTAAGKPRQGTIELRARNEGTDVVIEISDDGHGLDSERLKRKAVEKGLIPVGSNSMTEQAAFQLILLPGFSTAEKVTDVSGRGVGMDVVVNNIQKLKGTISIESAKGKGTTFKIKLPSNVMISRGILVECGESEYILPIDQIEDMIKVPAQSIHSYKSRKILETKYGVYPIVSLGEHFGEVNRRASDEETCVALIRAEKSHYGLIVDRFANEVEVVVKRLGGGLEFREDLLGASILGDGRVVLVLNPEFNFLY